MSGKFRVPVAQVAAHYLGSPNGRCTARGATPPQFPASRNAVCALIGDRSLEPLNQRAKAEATYQPTGRFLEKFHEMGAALGRDDFYVKVVDGVATEEKVRMGANDHRLLDRVRNFAERLVQKAMVEEFENAIVVFDGALTLRTYDTPGAFLRRLHETCQERGSSLIAVAKKTGLTVRGTDIRLLLDREGGLPARRKLTQALRSDPDRRDEDRTLGDLFVVRFGAGTETYRVDVAPAEGLMATEALDEFGSACLYRHGYPEPLVQAHAFSYMAPPVVAELQKHAVVRYQLDVKPEPNLGPVFAPFGGRFK